MQARLLRKGSETLLSMMRYSPGLLQGGGLRDAV